MSRLSLGVRVTLFYTCAMLMLLAIAVVSLFYAAREGFDESSRTLLDRAVKETGNQLEFEKNYLEISSDVDLYPDGVTLVLYGPEGTPLLGTPPRSFPADTPLISDEFTRVEHPDEEHVWEIYDLYIPYGTGGVWIRGIHSLSENRSVLRSVLSLTLVALPALILLALAGGYLVTHRALRPVREIRRTAEAIGEGSDLSRRIALPGSSRDELYQLAHTFDEMFDRLERSFSRERQFASDVSHELRTPIAAIVAQSEFALSPEADSEDVRRALEGIRRQGKRMSAMVSQLLALTRADQNRAVLQREEFDLSETAQALMESFEVTAQERGIRLDSDISPRLVLDADPALIIRLMENLVRNAIQYGRPGGFVRLRVYREWDKIILSVADDGIGIPKEHISRIFDRFYRVDPARSSGEGSSGLGLSMAQWIATAHGGTITVDSAPGRGSLFTVTLPAAEKEE